MKFGKHKHYESIANGKGCYYHKKEITNDEWIIINKYKLSISNALSGKTYNTIIKSVDGRWNDSSFMKAYFNTLFYPNSKEYLKHSINRGIAKNVESKQMYIKRALGYISFDDYTNWKQNQN